MSEALLLILSSLCLFYGVLIALFMRGLFRRAPQTNETYPSVSIIVPAKNEAHNITDCLKALAAQNYPTEKIEIILINDQSSDQTVETAQNLGLPHLKVITVAQQTHRCPKKNAIHHGILSSQGEIIFTTDADCRPEPQWIANIIPCFTPDTGMVLGYAPLLGPKGLKNTLLSLQSLVVATLSASGAGIGLPLTCTGRNLAYRRNAFTAVGGFDGVGHIVGGDDIYLMQKIANSPYKIVFHDAPGTRVPSNIHQDHQFNRQLRYQSKSFNYGPGVLLPALAVYIFHFILFGSPLWLWLFPHLLYPIILCLSIKTLSDALYYFAATKRFHQMQHLKWFPFIEAILYPYIVIMCALGALMPKKWK